MNKTNATIAPTTNTILSSSPEESPDIKLLASPIPYKKFLPEITPAVHQMFLQATGEIEYQATVNYMFQALFQEDEEALINLICSILHWPRSKVKSIEITNPILLGVFIEGKTFILDIKVLLNDNTIVNLEMQLNNNHNWSERSLGYLCRSFDNLNKGDDYINTKSAIHIGFLDYTLFPDLPEFHAVYKMQNIKNHNVYTDKFILHVIELNSIQLATKEDHAHEVDKWATLFKAKTWEDMHMIVNQNPSLLSAAETLYQLNMNEQLRETCDRFIRAEAREIGYKNKIADQACTIADLTSQNADLTSTIADQNVVIAEKDTEIAQLKAQLTELKNKQSTRL